MEGKTLSHFRIDARIGEGGMGVVYRAEDLNLHRTVAIKVLPAHLVGDAERTGRFFKEARAAAAVTHPSIATVHEIDEADGVTFIAMELVEGETLQETIDGKSLPIADAVRIATEIAEGLAAAHGAGIVHRDLKPDNVLIGGDGHVKIIDFGLARLLEEQPGRKVDEDSETVVPTAALTLEGAVVGTPAYMSPEQARGLALDYRTDLFSFGTLLYEMVTGQSPFKAKTATDTLSDILHKEPPAVASLNPEVPSSVQWILDKCLEKEAGERYQDTRDLVVDLKHLEPGSRTSASGLSRAVMPSQAVARPPWARPIPLALAALALVVAAVLIGRFLPTGSGSVPVAQANSLAVFSFENLKNPEDPERLGQILQELLITDLSGFEPVKVFSSQRLYDLQKQVGAGGGGKDAATAVARRAGAQNMLTGSLSQIGDRWMLTIQLADVETGTVLQSTRIDGTDLFAIADDLTEQLLQDLPGTLIMEEGVRIPVTEKTTSSVEAYQAYLSGVEWLNEEQYDRAAQELQEAIAIDPEFGQAYQKLAVAQWWASDNLGAGQEPLRKLLDEELYSSPKERRLAEATLDMVAGRFADGATKFRELAEEYPDEKEIWYGLGEVLYHFPGGGRRDQAAEALQRAVELDPEFSLAYVHVFDTDWKHERFDEAVARARGLLSEHPDKPIFHRYYAASLEAAGDEEGAASALAGAIPSHRTPAERQELYSQMAVGARERFAMERQGDYLQQALDADPGHDNNALRIQLLRNLRGQRKFAEVREMAEAGLGRNPRSPVYLGFYSGQLAREHRIHEQLALAERLIDENPEVPDPYVGRVWTTASLGDRSPFERAVEEARRLHTTPAQAQSLGFAVGTASLIRGDARAAVEGLEEARAVDPENEYAHVLTLLGISRLVLGDVDEAEELFQASLKINPRDSGAHEGLTGVALARGDSAAAIRHAEKAVEVEPRDRHAHKIRLAAHVAAGRMDDADGLVEQAMEILPTVDDRWSFLTARGRRGAGWTFLDAGEYDRAETAFRRAMALDAQPDPAALAGLATTQLARGEVEAAERTFADAMRRNPRHPRALRGMATLRLVRGDPAEAERLLREHWKLGGVNIESEMLLTQALEAQGKADEALEAAERIVTMFPFRGSRELLAWILIANDLDLDRGILEAEAALELWRDPLGQGYLWPFAPPAEHSLGLAYLKKGDHARAADYLQKAAEANPNRSIIQNDLRLARSKLPG